MTGQFLNHFVYLQLGGASVILLCAAFQRLLDFAAVSRERTVALCTFFLTELSESPGRRLNIYAVGGDNYHVSLGNSLMCRSELQAPFSKIMRSDVIFAGVFCKNGDRQVYDM